MSRIAIISILACLLIIVAILSNTISSNVRGPASPSSRKPTREQRAAAGDFSVMTPDEKKEAGEKKKAENLKWQRIMREKYGQPKDTMTSEWSHTRKDGKEGLEKLPLGLPAP